MLSVYHANHNKCNKAGKYAPNTKYMLQLSALRTTGFTEIGKRYQNKPLSLR